MFNDYRCVAMRQMQLTSLISYNQPKENGKLNEGQQTVMELLTRQHPKPMTDREITFYLGYTDPNKVRPRRKELVNMQLIKEVCKVNCPITKKYVIAWGLT